MHHSHDNTTNVYLLLFCDVFCVREPVVEEEVSAGRLVIEQALESAEVGGLQRQPVGCMQCVTCHVQAVWAQEDEAGVGAGGAECVKDSKEEEEEEEAVGEVGNRRRGRTTGEEL